MARRLWVAGAIVAIAFAALGCGKSSHKSTPAERIVYSDGITLHLGRFDGTSVVEIDSAAVPSTDLLAGHTIFGIVKHPSQQLLYVSSFNECWSAGDWCWGNARIDIFRVGKGSVSWEKVAFTYDASATLAACSQETSSYTGQVGNCAPVNGVFSADGTRLYMKDDDNDTLDIFQVETDGTLTLLAEGAGIDQHGMALGGTYLYNGTSVLGVASDTPSNVLSGSGGNDTAILHPATGDDLLLTTIGVDAVAVYSLADPAAPSEVSTLSIGSNMARAVVMNAERARAVVVGRDSVATVAFDGSTLTLEDQLDLSGGAQYLENREVALVGDESHAVVAWFQRDINAASGFVGGLTVYAIAADGTLTAGNTASLAGSARNVKMMTLE